MKNRLPVLIVPAIVPTLVAFLIALPVLAAQPARIEGKSVELHAGPSKTARTVTTLAGGQYVVASNLPLEGFYKVRTKKGEIGWVPTDSIVLIKRATQTSDQQQAPQEEQNPSESQVPPTSE